MDLELEHYNLLGLDRYCTNDEITKKYQQLSVEQPGDLNKAEAIKKRKKINLALNVLGDPELRKLYDSGNGKPTDIIHTLELTEDQLTTPNKRMKLKINVLELCPLCEGDKFGKCLLCLGVSKRITVHPSAERVTYTYYKCPACFGVSKAINSDECVEACRNGFRKGTLTTLVPIMPELLHSGPERDGTVVLKKVGNASRFPKLWERGDIHLKFIRFGPCISRTPADRQELRNGSSEQQNSNGINIEPLLGIVPPGNGDGSSESSINEPVGQVRPEDNDLNEETMNVEVEILSTNSTDDKHFEDESINDDEDSGDGVESDGEQNFPKITKTVSQLEEGREQVELIPAHISDQEKEPLTIFLHTTSGVETLTLENSSALAVKNHDSTCTAQNAHHTDIEIIVLDENVDGQTQSEREFVSKPPFLSLVDANGNPTPMNHTGEPSNSGMRLLCENSPESVSPRVVEYNKAIQKIVFNDLNKLSSHPSKVPNEEYLTSEAQTNLPTAKDVDTITGNTKIGGTSTTLDRCPDELVCNANNDSVSLPGTPISDDEGVGCTFQQDHNADTPTRANGRCNIKRKSEKAKLEKPFQPSKKVRGKSFTTTTGAFDSSAGVSPSTSSMRASNLSAQLSPPISYTGTYKSSENPCTSTPRNEKRK